MSSATVKESGIATRAAEWKELMEKKETLRPELALFLHDAGDMRVLRHPLVYGVPYLEQMNATYNRSLEIKQDKIAAAKQAKDWSQVIWLHERPYRLAAMEQIAKAIKDDAEYWQLLSEVYNDTENLWQQLRTCMKLLRSRRGGREAFMNKAELKLWADLPQKFVIYRGHHHRSLRSPSWTLSASTATWFADRWISAAERLKISQAVIDKAHVVGVLLRRGEYEVVVDPRKLTKIDTYAPPYLTPSSKMTVIHGLAAEGFKLGKRSAHGPSHWRQVDRLVCALCAKTPDADQLVCRLFAYLHDHKRVNENTDAQHGPRAAKAAPALLTQAGFTITPAQVKLLQQAIADHDKGRVSKDPTIGVCWDADRLDLIRVGIVPLPKLLSTQAAKDSILQL
jgi:uncharacterized protein